MIDTKILLPILGIVVAILAALKLNGDTKESFGWTNTPMTIKNDRVAGPRTGDMYTVPGNYQASLSPRFSNVDYGANIRYNMPSIVNLGSPDDPLTYGRMTCNSSGNGNTKEGFCKSCRNVNQIREGYCSSCGTSVIGCSTGGSQPPDNMLSAALNPQGRFVTSNYSLPSYKKLESERKYTDVTNMLPVGEMTMMNSDGDINQPIVYDRFMYANQRSKLYGNADPIRGDLPIVPFRNEWFRPSVHPQIDLRAGALAVMGGVDNNTSKDLLQLQSAAAGGLVDTGSGINYSVQKGEYITHGGSDVQVTAFP